jgi:hypothetical protein
MIEFIDLPEFDPILAARATKVHVGEMKRAHSYRAVNPIFTISWREKRTGEDFATPAEGEFKSAGRKIQTEGSEIQGFSFHESRLLNELNQESKKRRPFPHRSDD